MSALDRDKIAAVTWAARLHLRTPDRPAWPRWDNFTHATDELVTGLEGEVEFEIEGQVHRPAIGEMLLIPAGKVHSARSVGTTTSRWLYGYKRSHNSGA